MSPFFCTMRPRPVLTLSLFALMLVACASPTALPRATPTLALIPAPTISANAIAVIELTTANTVVTHPGERAAISLRFQPVRVEIGKTASGATFVSRTPWENANVAQMRVCIEIEKACTPTDEWMNFQSEWTVNFDIDWLGERAVWIGAQFRDGYGNTVPALDEQNSTRTHAVGAVLVTLNSQLDERTPLASQRAFAQTAVAKTRVAFPVTGALVLQDGLCCAGGKIGTTIEIRAVFEASSYNSPVTHMRLLQKPCHFQNDIITAPWEPFVKQKSFPYKIRGGNWVGWYLAVQYRDANGNVSPVYCDDISVEGMP